MTKEKHVTFWTASINELIAPLLTKYAIFKAGEAHPEAG